MSVSGIAPKLNGFAPNFLDRLLGLVMARSIHINYLVHLLSLYSHAHKKC